MRVVMQEATISELTAVNACLEREVGELEEERRRLKAHLKFDAKHSQVDVHPALTPAQLAAVDAFIANLKAADNSLAAQVTTLALQLSAMVVFLTTACRLGTSYSALAAQGTLQTTPVTLPWQYRKHCKPPLFSKISPNASAWSHTTATLVTLP